MEAGVVNPKGKVCLGDWYAEYDQGFKEESCCCRWVFTDHYPGRGDAFS